MGFISKIRLRYHLVKTTLFYRPFVKKAFGKFLIINPILFTSKHFIIGKNVFIRNNARLEGIVQHGNDKYNPIIKIGDNVFIEQNIHLTCAHKITIGNNTAIAANVTISDINHPYTDINLPPDRQPLQVREINIGEDCKIYNNVIILPGTVLGKHNVIGANSVVAGIFPDFCMLAGTPAKIIKRYNFDTKEWVRTNDKGDYKE